MKVALGWKSATKKLVVLVQILCSVLPLKPFTLLLVAGPAAPPTKLSYFELMALQLTCTSFWLLRYWSKM